MHRQKIVIVTVILIVFLFIVGGAVFSYFLRSIYIPISKDTSQIEFVITKVPALVLLLFNKASTPKPNKPKPVCETVTET